MKKLSFLMILCCFMGMSLLPESGYAIMTALTETGMREITGQAGIAITAADRVTLNIEADAISYGDENGVKSSWPL